MKLILKKTGTKFDVPRDIGAVLLAITDQLEEYIPPPETAPFQRKGFKPQTDWQILEGHTTGTIWISATCPFCKIHQTAPGPTPFRHCGLLEDCPKDIAKRYQEVCKKEKPPSAPLQRLRQMSDREAGREEDVTYKMYDPELARRED